MLNRTLLNTIAVFMGRITASLFGVIIGVMLARYLGPEDYGKYSFAISISFIFMVFANFGMDDLFVRDIAADRNLTAKYMGASVILKILFASASIAILYATLYFLKYSKEICFYTILFSLHIFFITQISTVSAIFRAHEKMEYNAYIPIINGVVGITLIIFLVYMKQDLTYILFSRVVTFFIGSMAAIFILSRVIVPPDFRLDFRFLKGIVLKAWPFLTIGLIHTMNFKIDIIMLSKLMGDVYVGYYTPAANDLFFGLFIIPGTVATVVYPIFSRQYVNSVQKMRETVNFTIKLLALIGVPISIGTFVLAPQIIFFIFGSQYENSIVVLRVMALAIGFAFVREPLGFGIASIGKEKILMWTNALLLFINIALNAILIPIYAHVGAAMASALCVIISLLIGFYVLKIQIKGIELVSAFYKPFIAAAVMGVGVFFLRERIHVVLTICSGAIVYTLAIFALKSFSESDLKLLRSIVKVKK